MIVIIYGTRGVTYSKGTGDFYCPGCRARKPYEHKRVRRFFTLFFIPIIPLGLLGEYIECQHCSGTYRLEVLDLDPNFKKAEFAAEFHRAIKHVMVAMMVADGIVVDKEVETIRRIYSNLTGNELSLEAVREEISQIKSNRRDITHSLAQLAGYLNDNGKEMVVKAAFMVAAADGKFQDEEKAFILSIGHTLGMSAAHLNGVISSMIGKP
ncbi:MAG: TerB family tellurite resistance protein [Planctomycetota bacterium]|jgi:tellurite resistance protein